MELLTSRVAPTGLVCAALWICLALLVLWAVRRFPCADAHRVRNISIHAALIALPAGSVTAVCGILARPPLFVWELTFAASVLLYAITALIGQATMFHRREQTALRRVSDLRASLASARLQALKMQLHPHFLFNALHSISSLIYEDPASAERTIARLAELLRLMLATSDIQETPLSEELRTLDLYLEIERTRFESRLQVRWEVPANLQGAKVPSLVLQPLVENSIRHGLARSVQTAVETSNGTGQRAGPGWIVVSAERDGDRLVLRVADNGEGLKADDPAGTVPKGTGLAITRARLAALYGANQSLVLRSLPEKGVEVRITLPLRLQADAYYEKDHVELQSTHR